MQVNVRADTVAPVGRWTYRGPVKDVSGEKRDRVEDPLPCWPTCINSLIDDEADAYDERAERGVDEDIKVDLRIDVKLVFIARQQRLNSWPNSETVKSPADIRVLLESADCVSYTRRQ